MNYKYLWPPQEKLQCVIRHLRRILQTTIFIYENNCRRLLAFSEFSFRSKGVTGSYGDLRKVMESCKTLCFFEIRPKCFSSKFAVAIGCFSIFHKGWRDICKGPSHQCELSKRGSDSHVFFLMTLSFWVTIIPCAICFFFSLSFSPGLFPAVV